jgi:hypothetical protein
MQGVEFMLSQLSPETLNRETLINKLKGGMKIPAGIFPAADFTRGQFGGTAVYSLRANCGKKIWETAAGPIGG